MTQISSILDKIHRESLDPKREHTHRRLQHLADELLKVEIPPKNLRNTVATLHDLQKGLPTLSIKLLENLIIKIIAKAA